MKRFAVLLVPLLMLAACVPGPVPRAPVAGMAGPRQCHVGPDGGAPVADRGIGGTGGPAAARADRGIGGTGGPAVADRGIGGTGITGIVTGFASVCVDGLEVALDDRSAVDIDGAPGSQAALRVGQLVAINAGPEQTPVASRVSVRHEVSGPVEAVLSVGPGLIVVAGQRVRVPGKTAGSMLVRPGVWVDVSGLRGPDGDIIASRLDTRLPGRILVHGPLIAADGVAAIGSLEIRTEHDTKAEVGTYVTASGTYVDGVLEVETLLPDLLVSNPPAWFGPRTRRLVLESYGQFASGSATVTGGFQAGLVQGFEPPRDVTGPVVMSLEQQADGSFAVVRASPASVPGAAGVMPGASSSYRAPGAGDVARTNSGPAPSAIAVVGPAPATIQPLGGTAPGQAVGPNAPAYRLGSGASAQPVPAGATPLTGGSTLVAGGGGGGAGGGMVYAPVVVTGAARIGAVSIAGTGGIRLMGAGVAVRGAAAMAAPHAFGLHLHLMRIRPGR